MPRPSAQPTTPLGQAIQRRRAGRAQRVVSEEAGVPHTTLSRLERGTHEPSTKTALALARWLGWSVEQVLEAAEPTNLQSR